MAGVSSERRVGGGRTSGMGTAPNSRSWWQSCSNGWTSRDPGGGEHLARLIREGYVQALLGGNAIAVHRTKPDGDFLGWI